MSAFGLAAATDRAMLPFKNLVWVEAGGLYCNVSYNFAGEIHGVTCVPQEGYQCSQLPTLMSIKEKKCLYEP